VVRLYEARVARAPEPRVTGAPAREPAAGRLRIDVGPRPRDEVQAGLLRGLDERLYVAKAREVDARAALRLVKTPEGVEGYRGETGGLDLLEDVQVQVVDG
jgi:hypothetical protein